MTYFTVQSLHFHKDFTPETQPAWGYHSEDSENLDRGIDDNSAYENTPLCANRIHAGVRMHSPVTTAPWRSSCCNPTAKPPQDCSSPVLTAWPDSRQQQCHDNLPPGWLTASCDIFALQHELCGTLAFLTHLLADFASPRPRKKCYRLSNNGILVGFHQNLLPRTCMVGDRVCQPMCSCVSGRTSGVGSAEMKSWGV